MIFLKQDIDDRYQYWALSVFFAYRPLALLLSFDKGQNLCLMIQILLLVVLYSRDVLFQEVIKNKINIAWLLLLLYHWLNHGLQGVPHDNSYIDVLVPLFQCYFLLVWTCYLALKDLSKTLYFMLIGYLLFIVLAATLAIMTSGYSFSSMEGDDERLSGSIHLTQMGATAGLTVFVVALLRHCSNFPIKKILPILSIPLLIVIMAASRNGLLLTFAGFFCIFLADLFSKKTSSKKIVNLLLISIPILLVAYLILQETYVGERLLGTKEQSENMSGVMEYKTGTILDYLGDRTWYYVLGFSNFLEYPIFGIGYSHFKLYNDAPYILHPEYMVELAEGGLVATGLFLFFLLSILYYLLKFFVTTRSEISVTLLFFLLMTLMACLSTTINHDIQYWPLFGLCVAMIMKNEEKINYITEKAVLGLLLYSYLKNKISDYINKGNLKSL